MAVDLSTTSSARWRERRSPAPAAAPFGAASSGAASSGAASSRQGAVLVLGGLPAGPYTPVAPATLLEIDDPASDEGRRAVAELLGAARTGWRFRLVGSEAYVSSVRSLLLDAGGIDDEIEIVVPEAGPERIRVFCSHCHTITTADEASVVPCSGCALELTVYYHFSRRQGAYLGYLADAEER